MDEWIYHFMPDCNCVGIVTILDYECTLSGLKEDLKDFTFSSGKEGRKILIDYALKVGMNQYRFIAFNVGNDGKILLNTGRYVLPTSDVIDLADGYLAEHPEVVMNSMLPSGYKLGLLNKKGDDRI